MKIFQHFKKPTYKTTLSTSLEQALHDLLTAEAALELAQARVAMHRASITRLEKTLNQLQVKEGQA